MDDALHVTSRSIPMVEVQNGWTLTVVEKGRKWARQVSSQTWSEGRSMCIANKQLTGNETEECT
jgi:hypothetical protein